MIVRRAIVLALLAACGDNLPPPEPLPDCSTVAPSPTGWGTDAAREAYRRAALRQRLRVREAIEPGFVLRETALIADDDRVARGAVCAPELAEAGRILFEHTFALGTPFQRVPSEGGAPEATSCVSCHWQRGPGGGGGLPDATFLLGDGDSVTSADARNPPVLAGAGVIEALAAEMTAELVALRTAAIARASREGTTITVELVAKGVSFGTLSVDARGAIDTSDVRGIDSDLVVRPFGWKGTAATLLEVIDQEAAQHLGVTGELAPGQRVALAAYVASLDVPVMSPVEVPVDRNDPLGTVQPYQVELWARGRALFDSVGCGSCHTPSLPLTDPTLRLRTDAADRGVVVDLARDGEAPRIARDPDGETYPVFLFSDLKRHNLGDENASRHLHGGIGRRFYLTRPLWGTATSAPYMHDGTAMTIDAAVSRHGGEGAAARDAWTALESVDRSALRIFLASLRRGSRMVVP